LSGQQRFCQRQGRGFPAGLSQHNQGIPKRAASAAQRFLYPKRGQAIISQQRPKRCGVVALLGSVNDLWTTMVV
jgi:hypothetical protein